MQKFCYLLNMKQWTNTRNKIILDIFLVQYHQLKILINAPADHNHSHNYCIYSTVQWHNAERYAITHQEVPCVRLSYDTEQLPEVFLGFLSPAKQK